MKKILLFFIACALISGCRNFKYVNHYNTNLKKFSILEDSVQSANPKHIGDSIAEMIDQTIVKVRKSITKRTTMNTITGVVTTTIGAAGALITPALNQDQDKKNLTLGISLATVITGSIQLIESTDGPMAYYRKALETTSAWDNSSNDAIALTALRAGLLSLQETWPTYAP